mmetsp:Transcript_26083/g.56556  ORF Transcript_26083/g.56556 Transcript_26083/m.56556 type:complete len:863 (-) Transcript_26083:386-2974(-)
MVNPSPALPNIYGIRPSPRSPPRSNYARVDDCETSSVNERTLHGSYVSEEVASSRPDLQFHRRPVAGGGVLPEASGARAVQVPVVVRVASGHLEGSRGGDGEEHRQEDEPVREAEGDAEEELLEERLEHVRRGEAQHRHRQEGGHGAVDDGDADVAQRLHHALVAGAVLVHEPVRQMGGVVDAEAEREHEHDDGDGVDVEPPPVHVPHDVHHHHPDAEDHQDGGQRVDDVHQHDDAHRHHRQRQVHGGLALDGLVLLVVEVRGGVREHALVAVHVRDVGLLDRRPQVVHGIHLIGGLLELDVVPGEAARRDDVPVVGVEHDVRGEVTALVLQEVVEVGVEALRGDGVVGGRQERLDPALGRLAVHQVRGLEGLVQLLHHGPGGRLGVVHPLLEVHLDGLAGGGELVIVHLEEAPEVGPGGDEVVDVRLRADGGGAGDAHAGDDGEHHNHRRLHGGLGQRDGQPVLHRVAQRLVVLLVAPAAGLPLHNLERGAAAEAVPLALGLAAEIDGQPPAEEGDLEGKVDEDPHRAVDGELGERGEGGVGAHEEGEEVGEGGEGDGGPRLGQRQRHPTRHRHLLVGEIRQRVQAVHNHEHVVHAQPEDEEGHDVHQRGEHDAQAGAQAVGGDDGQAHGRDARHHHHAAEAQAALGPAAQHQRRVAQVQQDRHLEQADVAGDGVAELVRERPLRDPVYRPVRVSCIVLVCRRRRVEPLIFKRSRPVVPELVAVLGLVVGQPVRRAEGLRARHEPGAVVRQPAQRAPDVERLRAHGGGGAVGVQLGHDLLLGVPVRGVVVEEHEDAAEVALVATLVAQLGVRVRPAIVLRRHLQHAVVQLQQEVELRRLQHVVLPAVDSDVDTVPAVDALR